MHVVNGEQSATAYLKMHRNNGSSRLWRVSQCEHAVLAIGSPARRDSGRKQEGQRVERPSEGWDS